MDWPFAQIRLNKVITAVVGSLNSMTCAAYSGISHACSCKNVGAGNLETKEENTGGQWRPAVEVCTMPNKPDADPEFPNIKWEHVEPVAKGLGWAMWKPSWSRRGNSKESKVGVARFQHFWESMENLFASLMVACVLGALVGIIHPGIRHIVSSVLSKAAGLSLTHMGTTIVAVGLGLARFVQTRLPDWKSDMKKLWADIGKGATVTVIVWFGLFVFCIFEAVKIDRQALTNTTNFLSTENTQLKNEKNQFKRDAETLRINRYIPFVEPKTSLRRRTFRLVGDLTAFWSRRPAPLQQPVQNPSTDEERKRNAKWDQYWRDTTAAYENAGFRERIRGIVSEYKSKGIQTGYLEFADQYNRLVGSAPFGGTSLEDCSRSNTDLCTLRELAYHVDAEDKPILLAASDRD